MCAHTAVYLVHRSCLCNNYLLFLPMSWILDRSILLSVCRAYICTFAPDGRGPEAPARPPLRTTSDARGTVKKKSHTKCAGVECWDEVRTVFGGIERGSLYSKQYNSSTAVQPTHRPRSLAAIVFFCPFIWAGTNSSREKKITAALDFEKLSILFSI